MAGLVIAVARLLVFRHRHAPALAAPAHLVARFLELGLRHLFLLCFAASSAASFTTLASSAPE